MALSFNVQYGGTVNINIRYNGDSDGVDFNMFQSDGTTPLDVSNYTALAFSVYDQEGLRDADFIEQITPVIGTNKITASWDYSADFIKLRHGYKYFFVITATDTSLTNQDVRPVKGELFIGS